MLSGILNASSKIQRVVASDFLWYRTDVMAEALDGNPLYEGFDPTRRPSSISVLIEYAAKYAMENDGMLLEHGTGHSFAVVLDGYKMDWKAMLRVGLLGSVVQMGFRETLQILAFTNKAEKKFDQINRRDALGKPWYVAFMATDPCFQGRGYGSEVLDHLKDMATKDGRAIYLEAQDNEALRFYQKHGFEPMGEFKYSVVRGKPFTTTCLAYIP